MLKKMVLALFVWCLLICQPLQVSAMSLNVQDGEVGELLRSVARMAGLNLILDESAKGKVSFPHIVLTFLIDFPKFLLNVSMPSL